MLISYTHNYGENVWKNNKTYVSKYFNNKRINFKPQEIIDVFSKSDNVERRINEAIIFKEGY